MRNEDEPIKLVGFAAGFSVAKCIRAEQRDQSVRWQ